MIHRLCLAALAALALPVSAMAQLGPPQDRYIVVLSEGLDLPEDVANDIAIQTGGRVSHVYEHALRGFAITMPRAALAGIQRDPRVNYVEEDKPVSIFAQDVPTGIKRIFADGNTNIDIDGTDDYRVDVDVAVIDTGIDLDHPELNVVGGTDCSGGGPFNASCSEGGDDDNDHGTHVAGTIAAIDDGDGVVGVAPGARLYAVKVLKSNGSGWVSGIVAGIDWVAERADIIEVANMSLGGAGFSQAEDDAIQGAVNKGVAFAVAAGNSDDDAGNYSPAQFDNVLTVSALADSDGAVGGVWQATCRDDQEDTLADFSNWGSAVQIAAPGVCILSTLPGGGYGTFSGTSMASPHAAGALALLASDELNHPSNDATDVQDLYDAVIGAGNDNWSDDSGDGIKEPLLDVSNMTLFNPVLVPGGGDGTTDDPPSVSVSSPNDGDTVSGDSVNVAAYASDDDAVIQVEFFVDGDSIGIDSDSGGGWSVTWDSNNVTDGEHTITAKATDTASQTKTSNGITVTVDNSAGGGDVTLSATGYKVKGAQHADLEWSGATSENVDVYRNGSLDTTTANDGFYTYSSNTKGGGSDTFQICEAGSSPCSNEATVTY